MNLLVIGKFYTEGCALQIAEILMVMGHAVQRFEPGVRSNRIEGCLLAWYRDWATAFFYPHTTLTRLTDTL